MSKNGRSHHSGTERRNSVVLSMNSALVDGNETQTLDRISTLLADRESEGDALKHSLVELPIASTLSHADPHLSAATFSVENFLLSRSHTSLSDLRLELRDYLANLKEELVQLINDDYAAFISLSTDLRSDGERLERLKRPLNGIRNEIETSLSQLKRIQDTVQERLNERSALREEKALLHLLLKLSESVARLENLLLITPPPQDGMTAAIAGNATLAVRTDVGKSEDRNESSRTNRVKHLLRVASEFTQLLYHVDKARAEKCAYVDEIQWRVDRIRSTLCSDLDHLFAATLLSLTGETGTTESEKARWKIDLKECLRVYDALGLWKDAEEVVRRDLMKGFVRKTIFSGALAVPHSPLIPRTPMHLQSTISGQLTPGTPYTPFTSRIRKTPFEVHFPSIPESHLPLLDDSDDLLASLYNKVLRFIERDLKDLMEAAETFSARRRHSHAPPVSTDRHVTQDSPEVNEGFKFMSNVVWAEIGRALIEEFGAVLFAVGRPDEFRQNYTTSQNFLYALEILAPSLHAVQSMRSHPTYLAFQRRWQLPVYFQLRWKDIVSKLEDGLASQTGGSNGAYTTDEVSGGFLTPHAAAVFHSILSCWSADICIPEIGHRFFRFTLQILSRYKTWLDMNYPAHESSVKPVVSVPTDKVGSTTPISRSPTPIQPSDLTAENQANDDILLSRAATVISDIKELEKKVLELWMTEISVILPHATEEDASQSEALKQRLGMLAERIPSFSSHIVTILTRRSCDALVHVRGIPSQYRAMSSKRLPTGPSHFVPSILKPVKTFLGVGGKGMVASRVREEFGSLWAAEIFDAVCQRYISYLTAMKKTEESLRRLKKGKMSSYSLFGGASPSINKDQENKDDERVRLQMVLDVAELGNDARSLGVDPEKTLAFKDLTAMSAQGHTEN